MWKMMGLTYNALMGSVSANIYTDFWPEFTAVVCEQVAPKLSDVSQWWGLEGLEPPPPSLYNPTWNLISMINPRPQKYDCKAFPLF